MLRSQSADATEDEEDAASPLSTARASVPVERSAYQPSRGNDLPAGIASLALVGCLIASLAWAHAASKGPVAQRLVMMDLKATPPPAPRPPEKAQRKIVQPAQTPISAPEPIVLAPAPAPVVAVSRAVPSLPVIAPPAPPAPPAAPATEAAPVDAGDLSSRMVSAKPPAYPLESRRKSEEGVVVLTVLLDTGGHVADIAVAQSSGFERLDSAALAAVRKWLWAPIERGGVAVAVQGRVRIPFVLKH